MTLEDFFSRLGITWEEPIYIPPHTRMVIRRYGGDYLDTAIETEIADILVIGDKIIIEEAD